ncbi:TetR/AcrR family transcriptional regulator [Magnetospira sp. QH-2]|uniref:TetR/AcrR family transcriptional regulator n=1 Tax=Magnetospira sp. (strain QH-2) TaxID=1288970 RepID=UPI0003E80CB3|nr:TetR/AcrR family transcriptional regulator [Magnetospira sp. QH-2]CCQ72927.1 putative Transcriptional regulator [Magnetospira sp. QH-2]
MARRSDHSPEELRDLIVSTARRLALKEGLRGITSRGIAKSMGYSAGTLYNHFKDLDDIIMHLNSDTLDGLYQALADCDRQGPPETVVIGLARRYIDFIVVNAALWSIVIEHRPPDQTLRPAFLEEKVARLLGLVEQGLAPLFSPAQRMEQQRAARVLWTGVYGVCALGIGGKLDPSDTMTGLAEDFITHYIAGLKAEALTN